MANHHSIPHPHYHLPPHPAHPPYPHPPPPGTPLATNGSAASPVPAAMATPAARGAPTTAPPPVIPHPASQLPALQKLAQANEQTWLLIGTVAEQMNDLDRALTAYEHAIRHNPHSIAGLTNIAGIARARENYSTAVEYFQRVLSLQRENGDVWSALGHCFLMKDDLQNAYSAYQQALYYLPNPKLQDPKLWYGIGILYDRYGSLEHAEEAFSSVLRMDKDFDKADEIFFRLGIIYKQQQKYEEALKCFERIHRNPPAPLTNIDIWFQIGHVYEQMKDYTAAKDAYERVLKDSPNHAKVLQQLGWLYHQAGAPFANQDTAIVLLTKSLESDPADPQSWYLLGRAYMAGQKYQKAYESYQQAVYRDGRNPTFWCSIGVLYYNINQFRDALDAYSRAIRINPYISEVWFDLGSLYESCNNQISDAIDAYARAAELDPGNPHITQRLNLLRNVQANGGTLPAAPGPQDIHPTAYAGGGPMNPMHTPVGPPPPLTGGPASGSVPPPRPARPDSRGPLPDAGSSRELPALGLNAPNARGASPPFHAPPPLQLDEGSGRGSSTRLPQMAPMDMDRAPPPPSSLFRSQSQGPNANPSQLPPPPALAAGASGYPEGERRTRSPSPRLPPPGNYQGRPGLNSLGPSSSYSGGYPNGEPSWERERSGREREREREREARDRESDRESRGSRQRQPSVSERVKVEILNQHPPERFFPGRGGPSSPVASRYDPRRSPPPAERPPEGRSPYMAAPAQPGAQYPGYWERERERGAPPKAPSRQQSPAPRDRESLAPGSSRRYDPRMDIDQEPSRREYWPEDQGHPAPHPVDRDRYSATPDGSRRSSNRGPEIPPHGSESPIPGGSSRAPVPEPVGKAARRRGAQAAAAAAAPSREQQALPPHPKEKKERKPPTKRGGRESSVVPPEREMSAPAPRAPGSAPVSQAGPPQHSTFKVTLGDSNGNALPPPPVPGSAGANHHRTQSGSNGSARSRATPSPTMGPPRREVDEDYDEGGTAGAVDALIGLSGHKNPTMRPRTASVHSVASPGPHGPSGLGGRHDAFAPPVTRSPPVSTSRPSPPFSRPASALPPHPSSPQSVRNGSSSNRSPPSSFARRGSEQPRDKTPLSLKRGMDDEGSGPLEKRHRVDVLNHPVPTVFPPPPSTASPNMSLGRRFDPVLSSVADTRMDTDSPKGEPALPPIATLPPPPDSPPRKGGDGDDGRSASERSGGSRTGSPRAENGA